MCGQYKLDKVTGKQGSIWVEHLHLDIIGSLKEFIHFLRDFYVFPHGSVKDRVPSTVHSWPEGQGTRLVIGKLVRAQNLANIFHSEKVVNVIRAGW